MWSLDFLLQAYTKFLARFPILFFSETQEDSPLPVTAGFWPMVTSAVVVLLSHDGKEANVAEWEGQIVFGSSPPPCNHKFRKSQNLELAFFFNFFYHTPKVSLLLILT